MTELGLFPLEAVLLPHERIPLHIFELRYQELIGECVALDQEFGLLFEDDEGMREIGTRARVVDVVNRFDDGRSNIIVEGRERFRVVRETRGRSFRTAQVEPVDDEGPDGEEALRRRAVELYRALGRVVATDVDEPDPAEPLLAYELAARVDFGPQRKQDLLELRGEHERLDLICVLLERAAEAITLERAIAETASKNGRGFRAS